MGFPGDLVEGVKDAAGAVVDVGRDLGAGVFDWETTAQKEARERMEAATEAGEAERAELEAQNRSLEAGISGYDPASISTCENWSAYGHQEIFERNKQLDEGKAGEAAAAWIELAESLTDLGDRYASGLKQKIDGGWEGEAAEAAGASGEPLAKWMKDSAVAFELTGNRIKEAGSAAGQAKLSVPEPEGHNYARTFGTAVATGPFGAGGDAIAQMKERQEAERAAQDTMARVLGTTYQNVDRQVPAYHDVEDKPVAPPPPPPPPNIPPPPPPVSPGPPKEGGGNVPPSGSEDRGADERGLQDRGRGDRSGPGDEGRTGPGDDGRLGREWPTGPAETDSAWATGPGGPPGLGAPGGGAPGGGSPGGLGGGGVGMGVMPGGAGSGSGSMAAGGKAGTGGLGAAGATGGAAAGARGGAAGGRGAPGMGGMGAGRGQGQGGEDQEHERPGWLEEQDDIWMEDMPKTAPPVFGE